VVDEGIMSVNLLKKSEIYNAVDPIGLPQHEFTREDLQKLQGTKAGSITIPSLHYACFEADIKLPFYCNMFVMTVSEGASICSAYFQSTDYNAWARADVIETGDKFIVDFNNVLPDQAQLVYKFRFSYANLSGGDSHIHSTELSTVDYPINFDYTRFSVVASSRENSPIKIYNKSVQQSEKDIRVLPIFSNDYEADSVYMLTASGRNDLDRYHIQRGFKFPEDASWESGRVETWYDPTQSGNVATLLVEDRKLTLSGTAVSGTWTSPIIYVSDPDLISMYVYGEDITNDEYIGNDFRKVDTITEVRTSDISPSPNFLVSSWTQRLLTEEGDQDALSLPARRPDFISYQDVPPANSGFWKPEYMKGPCGGNPGVVVPRPYILGRSKRMYVKGDGTIIAQSPIETQDNTMWEFAHRGYQMGIPVKEYGDINYFWNAGQFVNLMGSFIPYKTGACTLHHLASPAKWHYMTFSSEDDSSKWAVGKAAGDKLELRMPYIYHFAQYQLGCANEELTYESAGCYTMAIDSHPNEWLAMTGIIYPWGANQEKFLCVYYNHIRNFWSAEAKLVGIYGIGNAPCDESWAMCKRRDGNGFWNHIGHNHRIIDKYDIDANLIHSSRVNYGFSAIRETVDPVGMWGIRNDAIYWYSESSSGELVEEFSITNSAFKYLQAGDVDDYNNLWVVDRDTSTVYRINFSSRAIDYEKEIPFTAAVWPHPKDGSAYLYTSFNSGTFSTAINKISVDDPYGYSELVMPLPELPISDYSGVQFLGKSMQSYARAPLHDPVWGTNDDFSLEWQRYPNSSLALPGGNYKQFRITLKRPTGGSPSPKLSKIRIPKSLVLSKIPYGSYGEVYINPHLRYNKKYGHFDTELIVWWPH
jgi:hypothetical protein